MWPSFRRPRRSDDGGTSMGFLGDIGGEIGSLVGDPLQGIAGGLTPTNNFEAMTPEQREEYLNALKENINHASDVYGKQWELGQNQQALASALEQQARGKGPNPATAMLQAATDKANANAASLAASQRGVAPGLAAKMALDTSAANNQAAANEAAGLTAQQQLAARQEQLLNNQALGNTYSAMGQQALGGQQLQNEALLGGAKIGSQIAGANTEALQGTTMGLVSGGGSYLAGSGGTKGAGQAMQALGGAAHGARVPGHAMVDGDDKSNDKVHALLSPGEIVIPRSKANDPDKAKAFVAALIAKEKASGGRVEYSDVLKAKQKGGRRMSA